MARTMATTVFRPGDRLWLHLGLFGLTAVTTFGAFWVSFSTGHLFSERAAESLTFSFCLLLILGAHEMGHYVLARIHGVDTSLPYFIPFLPPIGTLGAVIRIRERIPNRNALVDIGAAGPLAGLAIAIPMMVWGVARAKVISSPPLPVAWPPESSLWVLVRDLAEYAGDRLAGHHPEGAPSAGMGTIVFGDNLLTFLLQRALVGTVPLGKDLQMNPVFLAAWVGTLVTMLNLIPIGQLDAGHLTYALFGEGAKTIGKFAAVLMLGLCVFWSAGWLLWLVITTRVIGFRHPEVIDPQVPLTGGRKWVCVACAVGLLLCVMPVPLRVLGG